MNSLLGLSSRDQKALISVVQDDFTSPGRRQQTVTGMADNFDTEQGRADLCTFSLKIVLRECMSICILTRVIPYQINTNFFQNFIFSGSAVPIPDIYRIPDFHVD